MYIYTNPLWFQDKLITVSNCVLLVTMYFIFVYINMAKNEHTSKRVASIASKILRWKPYTKSEVKSLAGSWLTQARDKKRK